MDNFLVRIKWNIQPRTDRDVWDMETWPLPCQHGPTFLSIVVYPATMQADITAPGLTHPLTLIFQLLFNFKLLFNIWK